MYVLNKQQSCYVIYYYVKIIIKSSKWFKTIHFLRLFEYRGEEAKQNETITKCYISERRNKNGLILLCSHCGSSINYLFFLKMKKHR